MEVDEERMEMDNDDCREEIVNLGNFFKAKMGTAFQPKHEFLNRFFVVGIFAYMKICCGKNHFLVFC